MTNCVDLFGDNIEISKEKLFFRPAPYAVIIHDKKILLIVQVFTGKYWFPGGGIKIDEKLEDGLKRETKHETGIEIIVDKLLYFKEHFFYYNPLDQAFHNLSFFFLCKPKTFDILSDDKVDRDEVSRVEWVDIESIKEEQFNPNAKEIIKLIKNIYK